MEGTLATFAASPAPIEERIRVARELAREVAALHRGGRVHGALSPSAIHLAGGQVVLAAARGGAPGFDAPEVARGARATRRSDAFSLGALAYLALTGAPPFGADEPLEVIRRALFAEPPPARLLEPRLSRAAAEAIARLLEKRPRRRGDARALVRALGEEEEAPAGLATATSTPTPAPASTAIATPTSTSTSTSTAPSPRPSPPLGGEGGRLPTQAAVRAALARLLPASPAGRGALATLAIAALALSLVAGGDAALAREVSDAIARGEHAAARTLLAEAARARPGDPVVEKLRGDLACASGAPDECVRRYRVALASRPELREDPDLRRNARALLRRDVGCGTRRAAAHLLGELRDPDALPALEEARRGGGLLAFLCTGDAIDRAIAATRAAAR